MFYSYSIATVAVSFNISSRLCARKQPCGISFDPSIEPTMYVCVLVNVTFVECIHIHMVVQKRTILGRPMIIGRSHTYFTAELLCELQSGLVLDLARKKFEVWPGVSTAVHSRI